MYCVISFPFIFNTTLYRHCFVYYCYTLGRDIHYGVYLLHSESNAEWSKDHFEPSGAPLGAVFECRTQFEGAPPKSPFWVPPSSKTAGTFCHAMPRPLGLSKPLMAYINPDI